jgi:hypothetical protein
LRLLAFGEKAVMTDPMEAVGQDVEQEASHELLRGKTHDAGAAAAAIVPVGERNFIVIDGHEPGISDGGSMRVAGETQRLFRVARSSPNLCARPSLTRSNRRGPDPYARWWEGWRRGASPYLDQSFSEAVTPAPQRGALWRIANRKGKGHA